MQTRVLALPAETADTRAATAFEDGNHNRSALHCPWLAVPNAGQCLIRYRLNESVSVSHAQLKVERRRWRPGSLESIRQKQSLKGHQHREETVPYREPGS